MGAGRELGWAGAGHKLGGSWAGAGWELAGGWAGGGWELGGADGSCVTGVGGT